MNNYFLIESKIFNKKLICSKSDKIKKNNLKFKIKHPYNTIMSDKEKIFNKKINKNFINHTASYLPRKGR